MRQLLTAMLVLSAAPLSASVLLSLNPSVSSVMAGNPVDVDVVVSGLLLPSEVGAFDVFIGYDNNLLVPTGLTFGADLGDPALSEALTTTNLSVTPNIIEGAEVSLLPTATLDALQTPSFTLFTLDFTAIANGRASFDFLGGPVDDGNGILLFGTKTFTPTLTPEPNSLLLTGLILCALTVKRHISARMRSSTPKHPSPPGHHT